MKKLLVFCILVLNMFATSIYKDGTYRVEESEFYKGWKNFTEIIVKNGKITNITFDKFNADGVFASQDNVYNLKMKNASGTDSKTANEKLKNQFMKTNDINQVDAVTGATSNSKIFKNHMGILLERAKKGNIGTMKI